MRREFSEVAPPYEASSGQHDGAASDYEWMMDEPGRVPGFFDSTVFPQQTRKFERLDFPQQVEQAKLMEDGRAALQELTAEDLANPSERIVALEQRIEAGRQARTKLIESCLALVVHLVKRDYWAEQAVSPDDLVQFGNIGLVEAVDHFDWRRGIKLSDYAGHWIHKEIKAGILDAKRVQHLRGTEAEQERADKIEKARKELEGLGQRPAVAELAAQAGLKLEWAWDAVESSAPLLSLDWSQPEHSDGLSGMVAASSAIPDQEALRHVEPEVWLPELAREQGEQDLEHLLGVLSRGERSVVHALYFEGNTTKSEIARELGVDPSTVDTQHRRALKKLRTRSPEFLERLAARLGVTIKESQESKEE